MKHDLNLLVVETYNINLLKISDLSTYIKDMEIKCGILQITAPGFVSPVQIEVEPEFDLILDACALGIQRSGCGEDRYSIPDGLYNIKYSISPNDKVYVEYDYLRVTKTLDSYYKELAKIEAKGCPLEDCNQKKLKDLRDIKSYIDIAQAKVSYLNDPEEGISMLKYANKKLNSNCKDCK